MPPSRSLFTVLAAALFVAGCAASTATTSITAGGPVRALAVDSPNPVTPPPAASVAPAPSPTPAPTALPTPTPTPIPTPAPSGPIVALGDSITYGYGTGVTTEFFGPAPAHSYPWDMARDLGIPVVNAGISGTTAAEVLDPASAPEPRPAGLQLPALLALHPRLMVVGFGTNEAANYGWTIVQTVASLRWDAALRALAAQYHAGLVLDVERGFTAADMTDWIHPNAAGYEVIADRIEPAVRAILG
jgi:lysophospholipase L1-like esterase